MDLKQPDPQITLIMRDLNKEPRYIEFTLGGRKGKIYAADRFVDMFPHIKLEVYHETTK